MAAPRFAVYVRRSRKEELRPGEQEVSTAQQLRLCLDYATQQGWTVPKGYTFEESGVSAYRKVARGQFDDMLAALGRHEVDGVLFWKVDRATRNSTDTARLVEQLDNGRIIASVVEGIVDPSAPEMFELHGLFAKMHSRSISVHAKRGKESLARSGRPSGGGRRRFGFEPDQVTHRSAEVELLREASRRIRAGEGTNTVAKDWNTRGLRMPGGSPWQATPLRRILLNPRTAGLRIHRDEILGEATWDAILPRPEWEELKAILTDPSRRQGGHPHTWLLSGIARCGGKCKGGLYGRRNAKDGRPVYVDKSSRLGGCNGIKVDGAALEKFVVAHTIDWLAGEGLDKARAQLVANDQHRAAVMDRLTSDEAELRQLANLKATNRISLEEWLVIRDETERRLNAAKAELDEHPQLAALSGLPNGRRALQRAWKKMPLAQQRAILRAVIARLVVHPAVRGRTSFDPDRVDLTFRDREADHRAGSRLGHDASFRRRIKDQADQLPHETDPATLDTVARAMERG
jgi:DNA invertase Pin-like site-specific DNA recombinase